MQAIWLGGRVGVSRCGAGVGRMAKQGSEGRLGTCQSQPEAWEKVWAAGPHGGMQAQGTVAAGGQALALSQTAQPAPAQWLRERPDGRAGDRREKRGQRKGSTAGCIRCMQRVCVLQRLGLVHRRLALGTTQRDRALQK